MTRKTDYALIALVGIADRSPAVASAQELADRLRLPLAALRNILKALAHHGVVVATQGMAGGYRLARPARQITLGQIIQAVQGPLRLARCCGEKASAYTSPECRLEESCRIKAAVRAIHHRLANFLEHITLEEIASPQQGELGLFLTPAAVRAPDTVAVNTTIGVSVSNVRTCN